MVDSGTMDWAPLVTAARQAREHAYAPYSGFQVGAALLMEDGSVSAGCNMENRTYGVTICAERVALASAVARGLRQPRAVAVVTDASPPSTPCGQCLQSLAEFSGPDLSILLVNLDDERREHTLERLLPHPFVLPQKRE